MRSRFLILILVRLPGVLPRFPVRDIAFSPQSPCLGLTSSGEIVETVRSRLWSRRFNSECKKASRNLSIGYQFAFARGKIFLDARLSVAASLLRIRHRSRQYLAPRDRDSGTSNCHRTQLREGSTPSLLRCAQTRLARVFFSFFFFFFTAWRATRTINIFARSSCISEQGN